MTEQSIGARYVHMPQAEPNDVSMGIQDIAPGGLYFVLENLSDKEYIYGSDYALFVRKNNSWEPVEPIIENWGFTSEGYAIPPKSAAGPTAVDWRWLYGELADGDYLFQKKYIICSSGE